MDYFYINAKIIDDKVIGTLPDGSYRLLIEIQCVASEAHLGRGSNTNYTIDELSWRLRRNISKHIEPLIYQNFITITDKDTVAINESKYFKFDEEES